MPAEFTITHRVQFHETDMAGIVHFSNYFKMMEEVEHAFLRSLGLSVMMEHGGVHIGWPRVAASCEYFSPVKFEDELELKLRVTRVGEKSLTFEVDFLLAGKKAALGKVTTTCVAIEEGKMRAMAIPAEIRQKLGSGVS